MHPRAASASRRFDCRGQAMVETCLVIILMCLIFLGLFQVLQAYTYREVLDHAAARAARARAVGFNDWMVRKCYRVATIPNAGRMIVPVVDTVDPAFRQALLTSDFDALWNFAFASSPASPQVQYENDLIPDYLGSFDEAEGRQILDYEHWGPEDENDDWEAGNIGMYYSEAPGAIGIRVRQDIPLLVSYADMEAGQLSGAPPGIVRLVGRFNIEKHYPLYLDVP